MKRLPVIIILTLIIAAYGIVETNAFESPVSPPASPIVTPAPTMTPRQAPTREKEDTRRAPKYRPRPPCKLDERC